MAFSSVEKYLISVGVILLSILLAISILFDPSTNGFAPKCFLFKTTGIECPMCGGQRSIHALSNGEWLLSWNYNHLPILFSVIILLIILNNSFLKIRISKKVHYNKWYILVGYLIGFFILRNLN